MSFAEGAPAEPAEGEEPAEGAPPEMVPTLTYTHATSGDSFLVGQTLTGSGVSAAACLSKTALTVPNVLANPAVHYHRMQRFGGYACAPVIDPKSRQAVFLICGDTLEVGGPVSAADAEFLAAVAAAISPAQGPDAFRLPAIDPEFDGWLARQLLMSPLDAKVSDGARAANSPATNHRSDPGGRDSESARPSLFGRRRPS
eukprot:SAG11_NODE_3377_length_2488_cov_18.627459_2_plen_200_part_00